MRLPRLTAMLAALLVLLTLAACASNAPPPLLLTLPAAAAAPAAATTPSRTSRTLVLRRVSLPEYLLTRRVRYRDSASSLADWPNTYWAERIEVAVTRATAEALRARLPGWVVCEGACADSTPADAVLVVDYRMFDFIRPSASAASPQLQAVALISGSIGSSTRWADSRSEHRATIDARADTPGAHAAAIEQAVRSLAQALAADLQASRP
jgi:uncharacterized lipoprotein YmbA